MDATIRQALARDRTIDITTVGRKSGRPRRIETWYYRADGRYFLSGPPGPRSWFANLAANPALVVHLKESVVADLPAIAVVVSNDDERRRILPSIGGTRIDLEDWVARAPLIEIVFD